jgi:hydrogenase expression/formation protein HypC
MCLAIPAKVVSIDGHKAMVDVDGNRRAIDISLVEGVKVGQYVLMHVGMALQVLDEAEALETLQLIAEAYGYED